MEVSIALVFLHILYNSSKHPVPIPLFVYVVIKIPHPLGSSSSPLIQSLSESIKYPVQRSSFPDDFH